MGLVGHILIMMITGTRITTTIMATIITMTRPATAIIMTRRVRIITTPRTPGVIIILITSRIISSAHITVITITIRPPTFIIITTTGIIPAAVTIAAAGEDTKAVVIPAVAAVMMAGTREIIQAGVAAIRQPAIPGPVTNIMSPAGPRRRGASAKLSGPGEAAPVLLPIAPPPLHLQASLPARPRLPRGRADQIPALPPATRIRPNPRLQPGHVRTARPAGPRANGARKGVKAAPNI